MSTLTANDSSLLSSSSQRPDNDPSSTQQQREKPYIHSHLVTGDKSVHYKDYHTLGCCDLNQCTCYAYLSSTSIGNAGPDGTEGICRRCHHPSIYHQVYTRQHRIPNKKKHMSRNNQNSNTADEQEVNNVTSADSNTTEINNKHDDESNKMRDATSSNRDPQSLSSYGTMHDTQLNNDNGQASSHPNSTTNNENINPNSVNTSVDNSKQAQSTSSPSEQAAAASAPEAQPYVSHPINTFPCSVDGCDCKKMIEPSSFTSSLSSEDAPPVRLCRSCKHAEFYHIKIVKQKAITTRNNNKKKASNVKKK